MWKRRGSSPCRCRRTSTGPRCATTSSAGAVTGRTWSGARIRANWRSFPRRATTSRRRCASPVRRTAPCATLWKSAPRRSMNPARAWRTGAICPSPMNSSGIRSAAIGATSTSTTWPPASLRTRSRQATSWLRSCCAWMRRRARSTSWPTGGRRGATRISVTCIVWASMGAGAEGRVGYFDHLYRVGFDGSGLTLLTPEDANHEVTFSPSGRFFVDNYSKPAAPPVSVLRDADGKLLATLEKADSSKLEAAGWKPPEAIVVKARDGVTDLYGLLFKPTNLDPGKKYPIVNHIYPGPQGGSVGGRSFEAARGDAQALAELGFIVVTIDGMGNPQRSKSFHDAYYGNMGDNTLPDQVGGMQQLARRFPWIDIERAGIWGHSGGGYAAADAMFRYPDFFKVGISEAGNHDNREYEEAEEHT